MIAKHAQWPRNTFNGNTCFTILNAVFRYSIGLIAEILPPVFFYQFFEHRVGCIVYQQPVFFYFIDKNDKLLQVKFKSGKYINMIPGDPRYDCHMWKQE